VCRHQVASPTAAASTSVRRATAATNSADRIPPALASSAVPEHPHRLLSKARTVYFVMTAWQTCVLRLLLLLTRRSGGNSASSRPIDEVLPKNTSRLVTTRPAKALADAVRLVFCLTRLGSPTTTICVGPTDGRPAASTAIACSQDDAVASVPADESACAVVQ